MADTEILVRPARLDDGPALEAIAAQAGLSFQAARDLDRAFVVVLVASVAGEAVGFVSMQNLSDEGEILDLGVLGSHRRRGVAKRLLSAAATVAREHALVQLFLEVRRSNLAAVELYRGSGFTLVGERKRYYRDGEDALLFRTLLESRA